MATEWATLYARLPAPTYNRIRAAAAADDRSVAKWVELHFRDYFERADAECNSSPGTSYPPAG